MSDRCDKQQSESAASPDSIETQGGMGRDGSGLWPKLPATLSQPLGSRLAQVSKVYRFVVFQKMFPKL